MQLFCKKRLKKDNKNDKMYNIVGIVLLVCLNIRVINREEVFQLTNLPKLFFMPLLSPDMKIYLQINPYTIK